MNYAWNLFLILGTFTLYGQSITIKRDLSEKDARIIGKPAPHIQNCASRIQATMDSMGKQSPVSIPAPIVSNRPVMDLTGYALHQHLRSAPYDMYITNMHVKVPSGNNWFRIDQCYFNPRNKTLQTRIAFNDMAVSGIVKLYDENAVSQDPLLPIPADVCNMTLRLRKSGLSVYTKSQSVRWGGPIDIQTVTRFIEPEYVSIYATGCQQVSPRIEHRSDVGINEEQDPNTRHLNDMTREMEDVFVKGIQSLLATYIEKQLQPSLRETLSANMGYTISYGK